MQLVKNDLVVWNNILTFAENRIYDPMIRHINDISSQTTSHAAGMKKVLLAANESGCSITQIAVMQYKAGEVAHATIHPDLQDNFYILRGVVDVTLDGETQRCHEGHFIFVPFGTVCELQAVTEVEMLAMGCVIEAERRKLYPMLFEPNLHEVVWGGSRLKQWKKLNGKEGTPDSRHIGESWEVSAVPSSPSVVSNGTWAGYALPEVIARRPAAILGKAVANRYGGLLPLLVKFIDARKDLSIQVHPNDEMARREHQKLGKSEMWYILDAEPGACLYAGFKKEISKEEYKERVANGTITEVLARHEVHKGDVFYLPAGRVHAICSGILLVEVQQSSDVTYRIYDYGRMGLDGRPRELHTELAAQAIDYEVYPEYRTEHREDIDAANELLNTPYFSIKVIETTKPFHRDMIKFDSFVILMCLEGDCKVRVRSTGDEVTIPEGYSCLIPAAVADYELSPVEGFTKVLETFINNRKSIGRIIKDFFHRT